MANGDRADFFPRPSTSTSPSASSLKVGFGDITPRTGTARLVVSAKELLGLIIIGAVVTLLFIAAKIRSHPPRRRRAASSGSLQSAHRLGPARTVPTAAAQVARLEQADGRDRRQGEDAPGGTGFSDLRKLAQAG